MRVAKVPAHLALIAAVFVDLHRARQDADYNHAAKFPKQTAVWYVRMASLAVEYLRDDPVEDDVQRLFAWTIARASGCKL